MGYRPPFLIHSYDALINDDDGDGARMKLVLLDTKLKCHVNGRTFPIEWSYGGYVVSQGRVQFDGAIVRFLQWSFSHQQLRDRKERLIRL